MMTPVDAAAVVIEHRSLSDSDIRRILGHDCKIIEYYELSEYDSLERLLPKPLDYVVILYEDRPDRGHWTALSRYNDVFSFLDPYGYSPDKELLWTPMKMRKLLGQSEPYLTELIHRTDKEVRFNNVRYQELESGINTCGSHVCCYLFHVIHKHMSLQDYCNYMKYTRRRTGLTYDEIVSEFVENFIH
jgi:hypothetical protein